MADSESDGAVMTGTGTGAGGIAARVIEDMYKDFAEKHARGSTAMYHLTTPEEAKTTADAVLSAIAEAGLVLSPAGGNVPKNPCPCCGRCLDAEPDVHRRCQAECDAVLIGLDGAEAEAYVTRALAEKAPAGGTLTAEEREAVSLGALALESLFSGEGSPPWLRIRNTRVKAIADAADTLKAIVERGS